MRLFVAALLSAIGLAFLADAQPLDVTTKSQYDGPLSYLSGGPQDAQGCAYDWCLYFNDAGCANELGFPKAVPPVGISGSPECDYYGSEVTGQGLRVDGAESINIDEAVDNGAGTEMYAEFNFVWTGGSSASWRDIFSFVNVSQTQTYPRVEVQASTSSIRLECNAAVSSSITFSKGTRYRVQMDTDETNPSEQYLRVYQHSDGLLVGEASCTNTGAYIHRGVIVGVPASDGVHFFDDVIVSYTPFPWLHTQSFELAGCANEVGVPPATAVDITGGGRLDCNSAFFPYHLSQNLYYGPLGAATLHYAHVRNPFSSVNDDVIYWSANHIWGDSGSLLQEQNIFRFTDGAASPTTLYPEISAYVFAGGLAGSKIIMRCDAGAEWDETEYFDTNDCVGGACIFDYQLEARPGGGTTTLTITERGAPFDVLTCTQSAGAAYKGYIFGRTLLTTQPYAWWMDYFRFSNYQHW